MEETNEKVGKISSFSEGVRDISESQRKYIKETDES
jgi:hypothetical protein